MLTEITLLLFRAGSAHMQYAFISYFNIFMTSLNSGKHARCSLIACEQS